MTVKEAATALGVAVPTVYELCRERRLAHHRVGVGRGRIVILPADVAAYLVRTRVEVEAEPETVAAPAPGTPGSLPPPPARRRAGVPGRVRLPLSRFLTARKDGSCDGN